MRPVTNGSYATYLRLAQLLTAQHPRTDTGEAHDHACEHFFITAHQASELWLKQILIDLSVAAAAIAPPRTDLDAAAAHLCRAAEAARLLARHLAALRQLRPAEFAAFRRLLGSSSGAQSAQFRALQRALGVRGGDSPVFTGFKRALASQGLTLADLYRQPGRACGLYRVAEALTDISQEYWHWHIVHLQTAERMLGRGTGGTGATCGVAYLAGKIQAKPFQELWDARAALYRAGPADDLP